MEDLGNSLAGGEGFIEAESNTKKSHLNEFCLNCGTKLVGDYCHKCGQKDIPRRQVIGDLVSNFIEAFTNFDGKFLRTTKHLFLRPGFLAVEYNKGKRETYFHPVRMYTFTSFLFFLLFVLLPDSDNEAVSAGLTKQDKEDLKEIGLDSTLNYNDSLFKAHNSKDFVKRSNDGVSYQLDETPYKSIAEYDSAQNALPELQRDGWWKRLKTERTIKLTEKYKNDTKGLTENFSSFFVNNFSTALFFLMPFFALLLKLLYVRRDYFYSEHLVFTIYYYNFFYLSGALMMIFNIIPWLGSVSVFIGIWVFFYLLVAMKKMYGQSWRKTIAKFFVFNFLFWTLVLVGIIFMMFIAIMSL
jgi:hypothetical protein